jgi:cellobiose-specific phosphotransferase system component IIC
MPFEVDGAFEFYSKIYDKTVRVTDHYRSNLASVPRIFWSIIPPVGRYSKATVIHDWLIDNMSEHKFTYHQINMIFKEAMKVLGVNWFYRYVMFFSVEFYWYFGIFISNFVRRLLKLKEITRYEK